MEEDMLSMFSKLQLNTSAESSDSNSDSNLSLACKRLRLESNALCARFKGVVPQPNGHWGAQIYANHQRIWLGTFKSEKDAAMAYDSAAIKLRSGDSHRNLPLTNNTVQEPTFQSQFSTETILNMIRDGSYPSKFADFLRLQRREKEISLGLGYVHVNGGSFCKLLFQKELTPSDVGKLNRLVIPKKYAVEFFPDRSEQVMNGGKAEDVLLTFYDKQMREWKFRYCYWKSSQSFVFTRGWNRFVKEKVLTANDTVSFYMYEGREGQKGLQTCYIIDAGHKGSTTDGGVAAMELDLQLGLERNTNGRLVLDLQLGLESNANGGLVKEETLEFEEDQKYFPSTVVKKKGLRLFGVQIID